MIMILHNVRSIHNVGSIFRSADGAGIATLYLTGITPSPLDRLGAVRSDFSKTALGAERSVHWEKENDLGQMLPRLKSEGYTIIGVEQEKSSIPYTSFSPPRSSRNKVAFIFGNEVKGIDPRILKKCDTIIEIPMAGNKESLNVSVAAGIILFHFRDCI